MIALVNAEKLTAMVAMVAMVAIDRQTTGKLLSSRCDRICPRNQFCQTARFARGIATSIPRHLNRWMQMISQRKSISQRASNRHRKPTQLRNSSSETAFIPTNLTKAVKYSPKVSGKQGRPQAYRQARQSRTHATIATTTSVSHHCVKYRSRVR